ncbi:MAG: NAD(P)-binding domain-containing protein [Candidatus Eisenbacteria bacterium]
MKTVAVLGSGQVGQVLADGFLLHGYAVIRGTREPAKLDAWRATAGANASVDTFGGAARAAEIVVLAVKGSAAGEVLDLCGADTLDGKIVIDATNPIADAPPENGVLRFFTTLDDSLMERLQRQVPKARFVKAFNQVGNAMMIHPKLEGGPPTMFICGDDADAKHLVSGILKEFGWESADMAGVEGARAIEPLCILWLIPAFTRNQWGHAFKLLGG